MRPRNFYSHPEFDRRADKRGDDAWLDELLNRPSSRIYPVFDGGNLLRHEPAPAAVHLHRSHLEDIIAPVQYVYLGEHNAVAHFAGEIRATPEASVETLFAHLGQFRPLRDLGMHLEEGDAAILAYARGLLHWQSQHRHCGVCGAPTETTSAGHVLRCTSSVCGKQHFPRSDPAVITLVTARNRCVLARRANWPALRRSTIAGFVEPGEALEDAVAREIWEEVGLKVDTIHYHSSQPWPFPASLMLGFWADATTFDIQVDGDEIAEADWYTPEQIAADVDGGRLLLPPEDSISYRLIQDWLAHIS